MLLIALLIALAPVTESPAYVEGVRLYNGVELEASVGHFEAALKDAVSDTDKAQVHAWIGLIHAQLGDADRARESFRAAVALDVTVRLPAAASPDVEQLLEAVRPEKAAPPPPPPPTSPPAPAAPETAPTTWPPLLGVTVTAAGGVLVVAGAVAFGVGLDTAFRQAPAAEYNDEARALVDVAYTEYVLAAGLASVGIVALAGGSMLLIE